MIKRVYNFFVPNQDNSYTPLITRTKSIFIFALVVFAFNISFSGLGLGQVKAALTINDLVALHNQERQARGLGQLTINSLLNSSAQNKANAMLAADCWSHYCPDGKSPWEFFNEVGYIYVYAGENLAHGFTNAESVMQAWMNSPTHRANILKAEFEEIGIGFAYGSFQGQEDNVVIAVHFGTRQPKPNVTATPTAEPTRPPNSPLLRPEIVEPQEDSIQRDNTIPIIGTAEGAETVDVYNKADRIGSIPVGGGIFTYRPTSPFTDGEQQITVQSFLGGRGSQLSEVRKFIIDTQFPEIKNGKLTAIGVIAGQNSSITINLETNEALSAGKFILGQKEFEFRTGGELIWQSDIPAGDLDAIDQLTVQLTDLAGNQNNVVVEKRAIENLEPKFTEIEKLREQTLSFDALTNLISGLKDNNLKAQINLVFIVISMIIIMIDFVALRKTGFTGFSGKQHLHLTNFVVLFIVILVGGLNGQLLDGLNIRL